MIDWSETLAAIQRASSETRRQAADADAARRVARARALIDRRFAEPLDLDRLAAEAAFSPYHFLRVFRREVGETPHRYLTRRRIERARELLITTDLPITEVCLEVGFQSLGSFSSSFTRHAGHAPSRYRRRVLQSLGVPAPRPRLAPIPACFLRMFASW